MPNIASALRDEISRVARKSNKADVESLRKASAEHRRQIAALKRQIASLSSQLRALSRNTKRLTAASEEDSDSQSRLRFSAKGLAAKREQLGLSAAEMAKLLGVSSLSVYKWESGKTRPRDKQLQAIASLRSLGKRAAMARLAELDG